MFPSTTHNKPTLFATKLVRLVLFVCALQLSACASNTNRDPLEGINRVTYHFNDITDKVILRPVATVYKTVTPSPVRSGVNNFFNNIYSLTSVLNNLLQFKISNAFTELGRFAINSTFGIGGLFDLASKDGVKVHKEDFGQTLGFWGLGNGPYLVLPLLGPSSGRDLTGFVFDSITSDPLAIPHNNGDISATNYLRGAYILDKRAQLLPGSDLLDEAALDPYSFMRDAYFQRRDSLVHDGNVNALNENAHNEENDADFYKDSGATPPAAPNAP